jgi:translation initiation factor 2-alpha kinase 4
MGCVLRQDLKPANVFYDARGDIKLGDFGLAKFASAAEASENLENPDAAQDLSGQTALPMPLS